MKNLRPLTCSWLAVMSVCLVCILSAGILAAQSDPGVRPTPAGAAPQPLTGLNTDEAAFFRGALLRFQEVDGVNGTITDGSGLGPRFNADSCATCHAAPFVGGTSPAQNPQVALATRFGATNTVPSFISLGSAVREARFIDNADGTPDGGVHDLFVITGRTDAKNQPNPDGTLITCNITQPNFAQQLNNGNVIARIPTPTFGLGLIEAIPDGALITAATNSNFANFGVAFGKFNRSGNDGTITRFGWKAQNKSLLIFSAEAYNVEQGVTNEGFTQEREENANCQFNALPEDRTKIGTTSDNNSGQPGLDFGSDVAAFAHFMRLSEPVAPAPGATAAAKASIARGHNIFTGIGCATCHVESQTVGFSSFTGQSHRKISPFSDFATHLMGDGLFDGVTQGNAGTEHFRSAPLWGLGQRIFFLHDGRTKNLITAIQQHSSNGSEANQVESNFELLSASQQQDLLNFLRSL